ncbi:MAG: hypothetical protein JW810_03175 [Sedimentisphaerales bacterium]|nr:hypothetical protein [Sedimentisphaerales bacterium]
MSSPEGFGSRRRRRRGPASLAGWIFYGLTLRRRSPDADTLAKVDYSASSQRMGIRFTETLRDLWRPRWLRRHVKKSTRRSGLG